MTLSLSSLHLLAHSCLFTVKKAKFDGAQGKCPVLAVLHCPHALSFCLFLSGLLGLRRDFGTCCHAVARFIPGMSLFPNQASNPLGEGGRVREYLRYKWNPRPEHRQPQIPARALSLSYFKTGSH